MLLPDFDPDTLSEREQEVVRCIGRGLTYVEAGRELYLSPHTVRVYARRAAEKASGVEYRVRDTCHRIFSLLAV